MTADGKPSNLERLRELMKNRQKLAPIARLVDAHIESVDPGRVRVRYAVKPEFMHPGGAVQGGIITAYADMAMAMAAHTLCSDGEFMATSQLSISFLAPVLKGPVFGEGTVVRRGRSTFFLEAVVKNAEGVELARATSVGTARRLKL
ncbi:MAG: PaaI family thioesterase [Candidatus Rokubacteria bacterium]|nr:PaaI family thioesterase [Candidatus Rokubacteria bacterium]